MKTLVLTLSALVAFAANSVLCRMALGPGLIDAASFTSVRLISGAIVLMAILQLSARGGAAASRGSWLSGVALFVYAIAFSYAYITLDTGTGALILFGSVQISMILISIRMGNRLKAMEWLGASTAFGGFVYLVLPGVSAPSPVGFLLMSVAGVAWGVYTLRGKGSDNPLADTCYNFLRTAPLVLVLVAAVILLGVPVRLSTEGVVLAVLSGAVASGLGYTIWYTALRGMATVQAAVVQLSVPVIAALGGVLFSAETITWRLMGSAVLILGGILMVVLSRQKKAGG